MQIFTIITNNYKNIFIAEFYTGSNHTQTSLKKKRPIMEDKENILKV